MYGVDFNNQLADYLLDPNRRISAAHLNVVCKMWQKNKTCRYIARVPTHGGFYACMKKSPAKEKIDASVKNFSAKADNCEGLGGKL